MTQKSIKPKLDDIEKCQIGETDRSKTYDGKKYCLLISPGDKIKCEYITGETINRPRARITRFKIAMGVPDNILMAKRYICSKP